LLTAFALLAVLAGVAYQTGWLGKLVALVNAILGGSVRTGFRLWRRLLAWASWPVFAALVLGLLVFGVSRAAEAPALGLLCSLVLLFVGTVACLAYVYIDLERYDVSRGYKALHNPLKGQELAANLVRYGGRVGIPLLGAATVAMVGGFALLNQAVYDTVGSTWYEVRAGKTAGLAGAGTVPADPAGKAPPEYADFLAYTLIHLFRIVDLLDIAGTYNLQVSYVQQKRWPASTLLVLFKSFFTLVLLQQIFASVRQMRLLGQAVRDFWSPHVPIREQARAALPQHGAGVVQPLFSSLREVEVLTPEQRAELPAVIAEVGSATIPVLVRHLRDPNENVRAVAAAALGRVDALKALPRLALLADDPSDVVRLSLAETLGSLGRTAAHAARRRRRFRRLVPTKRRWPGWVLRLRSWARRERKFTPVDFAVETLRPALRDPVAAVRKQAAASLCEIGPAAAAAGEDLIGLLKDADEGVRCQAAEALGSLGGESEPTVAALTALLQDPSTAVQTAAAKALGALKKVAAPAVPSLIPLLTDPSDQVRQTAAEAIGRIGTLPEETTPDLVEGLAHADNVVRAQTAEALGTIGTPAADAVPALVEALGDPNDRVRVKTAEALGKIGPAAAPAVPALVRALGDEDNLVRVRAADALGEIGPEAGAAIPALAELLGHGNPHVRAGAARALGRIGPAADQALPGLLALARDEDGEVRAQAVFAVGAVERLTEAPGRVLLDALRDSDPQVRSAAVAALAKHPEVPEAGRAVAELLGDSNAEVRAEVARALAPLAGPGQEVIDGLCRLLQDDDPAVQVAAAQALGKLGPDAAAAGPFLLHAVKAGEAAVREQALRAVVLIQPAEAAQAFAAGLKDAAEEVRKLASAGLMKAKVIPADIVPDLVEALRDPEIQVRSNAAHALARLREVPPQAVPLLVECTNDLDDGLRMNAVLALKAASPEAAGDVAARLLDDPTFRIRLEAAGWLLVENAAHPAAGEVLRQALADPAARHRKTALEVIESLGPGASVFLEACRERVAVEVEPEVRAALVQVVERLAPAACGLAADDG
jgi:HEAT repeat protein